MSICVIGLAGAPGELPLNGLGGRIRVNLWLNPLAGGSG
jgi:hypothetical protein